VKTLRLVSAIAYLLATVSCNTNHMEPYPRSIGIRDSGVFIPPPVIIVGTVIASEKTGSRLMSPWDGDTPYQQFRTSVAVENVLRGNVQSRTIKISYMADLRGGGGHRRLGMESDGGSWRVGDREMFFLQRDAGQLRTVCDDFAFNCVLPVQSGRHDTVQQREQVGEMIADVFLSRGSGVSDAQMAAGLDGGGEAALHFAPEYSALKLEELIEHQPSPVRAEACKLLEIYSLAGPCQNPGLTGLTKANPAFIKAMSFCPKSNDAGSK
jgi:hypothetical protein